MLILLKRMKLEGTLSMLKPTVHQIVLDVGRLIYAIGQVKHVYIGKHIFDNLCRMIEARPAKKYIDTPSMFYERILRQALGIKKSLYRLASELGKLYANHKLFEGDHLLDVIRWSLEEQR